MCSKSVHIPTYPPHASETRFSYAQFVFISKEIGTLENEMMELRESLSEWKGMPSVLHIEESASVAGLSFCLSHSQIDTF